MSVSHPVLKELKVYASRLLNECEKPVNDYEPSFIQFCDCFERILSNGLIPYETLIFILTPDCWQWLKNLADEKCGVPYLYTSSVEEVLNNPRVETNKGKSRLLIRTLLVKKCLHFPIQYLVDKGRCCFLYESSSILGDPILASVLASVLLCISTISFHLNLSNASFLDTTWHLPLVASFTFVPAQWLGLTIVFIEGKAIIVKIQENSVASENGAVEVGDIVDSLNGRVVDKRCQGSLSKIVKKMRRSPLNITFVKGRIDGKPYLPVLPYWQQAGLDTALIQEGEEKSLGHEGLVSGVVYLGSVNTGDRGDLKQIQLAIRNLSESPHPLPVSIECHHLGLRVKDLTSQEVIMEHNYMDISACGCSQSLSPYFAFIAGNKALNEGGRNFICYIFKSSQTQLVKDSRGPCILFDFLE